MESSEVIATALRHSLRKKLRETYVYMDQDAIDNYARRCERDLQDFIKQEMPRMQDSHARANLMALPAELRNRIYELVLTANEGIERPDGSHMIEIAEFESEYL